MKLTYVKGNGKKERHEAFKLQEKIGKRFEKEDKKEEQKKRKEKEAIRKHRAKLPFKKKQIGKSKFKVQEYSAEKAIMKGLPDKARLVKEGETGYFKKEIEKERKWLSR